MGRGNAVFGFLDFIINTRKTYQKLSENEETRAKTVRMGAQSILQSILSAAVVAVCLYGIIYFYGNISSNSEFLVSFIMVIICGLIALAMFISGFIGSLVYSICQMKLNRRAVGWVSLLIWFLCLAGIAAFVLLMLN